MRYNLQEVTSFGKGLDVTDEHRQQALEITECEVLEMLDEALQCMAPHVRKYGGTLATIIQKFQDSRGIIGEEFSRIARRNLQCVVSGNLSSLRIMNAEMAIALKEARQEAAASESVEPPFDETDETPVDPNAGAVDETPVDPNAGAVDETPVDPKADATDEKPVVDPFLT